MKLVPQTLAGRISLLLVLAILLANLLSIAILAGQKRDFDRRLDSTREIERVIALVPVLEAVDADARASIARDASSRFLTVGVDAEPRVGRTSGDPRARFVANRIAEQAGGRPVAVNFRPRGPDRPQAFAISIGLRGLAVGEWLNLSTGRIPAQPVATAPRVFGTILVVSLVFVLAGALWMARAMTRPLRQLADAADAAGRGDRSQRVPEEGVREVREAARAFNDMQARIGRFDAERTRTLAAVGHDLRTPLTSLRLRAEMIEDEETRAPMIRTLDELAVMADGLVTFARDGGEAESLDEIDLGPFLERLCTERGGTWQGGPALKVRGRPVALGRAFGNVIDNAVRYGGVALVSLEQEAGDARVTIRDEGPGIPPERLADMFEPFARGDHSRSVETGGAGLGLSIARTIVTAHAGRIDLQNAEGGGLVVTVSLPLA